MFSCEFKPLKKEESQCPFKKDENDKAKEVAMSARKPSACYCKYNVDHAFKSAKERDTHQEICPERALYDRNAQ